MDQMKTHIDFIIIDGNRFTPYRQIPFECIVKGDRKYSEIAAASILAKTYRDEIMYELDKVFFLNIIGKRIKGILLNNIGKL